MGILKIIILAVGIGWALLVLMIAVVSVGGRGRE